MSILDVELSGPDTRCTAPLPDDVALEDLLPTMATLVGDGPVASSRWMVATARGGRIPTHLTLAEAGAGAGDVIHLARQVPATDPVPEAPTNRDDHSPSERARQTLPRRVGGLGRISAVIGALLGTVAAAGTVDAPPLRRAFDMWHWTDRRRRLEWLIRRPRLERTATIGVVGVDVSGTEVAVGLAVNLSAVRADRVVLVDGDPIRAVATRLVPGQHPSIGQVASGLADIDARFAPARLVAVDLGQPTPPTQSEYRRALERIRRSAGLIVIDCGPVSGSCLADLCDQLVVVACQPPGEEITRRLARRSTVMVTVEQLDGCGPSAFDRALPTAAGLVNGVDGDAGLELAALVMSRM